MCADKTNPDHLIQDEDKNKKLIELRLPKPGRGYQAAQLLPDSE
jgi:hypothetical protein